MIQHIGNARGSRFALTAIPAAGLTLGLFLGMTWMIKVDDFTPPDGEVRVVEAFQMPETEELTIRPTVRAQKLEVAIAPPPPPVLRIGQSDIKLEPVALKGAAPADIEFGALGDMFPKPVAINYRDTQPIRPPVVSYPRRAMENGTEASCDVRFDVTPKGLPYNIQAICTDRVFEEAAERAIARVEFIPQIVRGQPVERKNVVYPLIFKLES